MRLSRLLLVFALLAVSSAEAQQKCSWAQSPSATLLFPYFELSTEGQQDSLSLISISNTDVAPTLANVVVWSNCGRPVLDFTLYLEANQTLPLNLQQVLVEGRVPETGPADPDDAAALGCESPLARPILDAEALATLRARLAGQPDPTSNTCYAKPPAEGKPVAGYITVDTVGSCSTRSRTPLDDGYFAAENFMPPGPGRTLDDNILTGDFFFVDEAGNAAQGFEAIAVVAGDVPEFFPSFYALGERRLPLPQGYRGRFLKGGDFDGGTELIYWAQPQGEREPTPAPCDEACENPTFRNGLFMEFFTEAGASTGFTEVLLNQSVARLTIGTDLMPDSEDSINFGSFEGFPSVNCPICSPPTVPIQGLFLPIYTAEGRFSASVRPTVIDPGCLP